jgi:hypothetical protein
LTPGQPPIEYLENGEQPHFIGVSDERAIKVKADENINLHSTCRVPVGTVQQGLMYHGKTGYLNADDPYANILFITNRRLLLFVGKEIEDIVFEFRYDDEAVSAFTTAGQPA